MHLLHVDENGTVTEVQHEYPLRGIMDAFGAAQNLGDGRYIADFGDGSFLPFNIEDGQEPQGDLLQDVQYGNPHRDLVEEGRSSTVHGESSGFPSLVPDVAGQPHDDSGQTFEDYTPNQG